MEPLVFEPYLRPQVWGGRNLERDWGKPLPAQGFFGESWEISGHGHHVSRVAEGPLRGELLTELWAERGPEILGRPAPGQFPLLVKLLDCQELLSVQVHPSDQVAAELLGEEFGKTEAWVVLSAGSEGRIYAGLRPGTTRAELERRLDDGTVAECLHCFAPKPGDCILLSAGTVHAVGGGVVIAEVQQSSDATFRLFDWNRLGTDGKPRPLHREQALRSIDWSAGRVLPVCGMTIPGLPDRVLGELLVTCDYFELSRFTLLGPMPMPFGARLSIWIVLKGLAELQSGSGAYRRVLHAGETVLVPALAGSLLWNPAEGSDSTTLLAATP